MLRIEHLGLPRYAGHGRGSLNLSVIVDIPRQLSPRQQQLYEQLREADSAAGTTGEAAPPREPGAIRRRWRALTHRHAQDEVPAD